MKVPYQHRCAFSCQLIVAVLSEHWKSVMAGLGTGLGTGDTGMGQYHQRWEHMDTDDNAEITMEEWK